MSALSIKLLQDTGTADNVTSNDTLTGTATANALLTFTLNGTKIGTTTANFFGAWTFTPVGLSDGTHQIVVSEPGASTSLTFTLDTTAPVVTEKLVSDTGVADGITSNPALTGTADPNATVTLKQGTTTLGTTKANASGIWTFTPTLSQGAHTIVASETDLAGNVGTASLTFTLDTVKPVVTEKLVSDTGAIDGITSNPALTGTGDANATVTLKEGATTLGTTKANASGVWTFTPTLSQGAHTIVASETDGAGNVGTASLTFTLDSVPPVVTEKLVSDTGAPDGITANPALTGTADPNATVTLKQGTKTLGTTKANASGIWTFTPTLSQGVNTIVASETDVGGNVGTASLTFTLDTVKPVVTEKLVSDTGATDGITSNPALTGAADRNATVMLKEGATTLGTTTANASGVWNFTPTLSQGANTIVASETDGAGNVGTASLTFTLDSVPPVVTEKLVSDTGAPDGITANPALTGTADPNATVTLKQGTRTLGTTRANALGVWTFTPTLSQGVNTIVASETDVAGNVGTASLTFTLDTVKPVVTEKLVSDTGAPDGITSNPALTGAADPNATVTLKEGAATLGTATANASGVWTFTPTLNQGANTIVASETDGAGNVGTASLAFTLDSVPPVVTEKLVSDTGAADGITANPALTGTADPNATITLKQGTTTLGTTRANASGVWTFTPTLTQGAHTIVASETDVAGNVGTASLTFTLDTVKPVVTEKLVSDTGAADGITSNPALTGTADPNATVTLTEGATILGTTTTNGAGAWTFTPTLSQGANTIVASDTDGAGNVGTASLTFTLDSVAPAVTETLVSDTGGTSGITSNPALTGMGDPNAVVTLTEGANTLGTAKANASGVWSFTPTLSQGLQTIVASETDVAGNIGTASLTFTFDNVAPVVTESLVGSSLVGTGDGNAVVTLTESGILVGSATADTSGNWSFAPTLSPGAHTVVASETDVAGNVGTTSLSFTLASPPAVPAYSHIVVVMEENENESGIIGNITDAPYINSLAAGGAVLTNYAAITHPSQPNYFALYAGSTFGTTDDDPHSETGPTLATTLAGAGLTFTGYVDQSDSDFNHNPWDSFPEGNSVQQDFSSFPALFASGDYSSLPTVSFVIPGVYNDMHDGTVLQGDDWLQANLSAYAQWAQANNSLLVIDWDESADNDPGNLVPAILYGAGIDPGDYNTAYNHYDMLSMILAASGLTGPNNAATAAPIQVFGSPAPLPPGTGTTISSSVNGPVTLGAILGTLDNPLTVTATGTVTSTGSNVDAVDGLNIMAWTIANDGTINSLGGLGISLSAGGAITNGPSNDTALISGVIAGIAIYGAAGTVTNEAQISGAIGISLADGGNVRNATSGTIAANTFGILVKQAAGTVDNEGGIAAVSTISGALSYGVAMLAGGTVTNTGSILGGEDGVIVQGALGTVVNAGAIAATVDDGVALFAGGTVVNSVGGSITGVGAGVFITGDVGTVINSGTITDVSNIAVFIDAGGSVDNTATGYILGYKEGIFANHVAATVTNAGSINATGVDGAGIYLENSGLITNNVGATVRGEKFGVFTEFFAGTIVNAGSIAATTYDGVVLGKGGMVNNAAGASITGNSGGIYIKYRADGTVTNFGSISSTGSSGAGIDAADGGSVGNYAGASISGGNFGVFITGASGTVDNAGSIAATTYGGVALEMGGTVVNSAGGSVSGGSNGIYSYGVATVTNAGSISATGAGVAIKGGSVTNDTGASISGGSFGVFMNGPAGTVTNYGLVTGAHGVALEAGGAVTNASGAVIAGGVAGVLFQGAAGTLANAGSISATASGGAGADVEDGGTVTNAAAASLSGASFGVFLSGNAGTVVNSGSVAGTNNLGMLLEDGGSVTNNAGAAITGFSGGVYIRGASGTVTNAGSIIGTTSDGVALGAGGSVVNLAGGLISDNGTGVGVYGGSSTVTNAGTITGGGYAIRFNNAAPDLLVVNPGAVFNGEVMGGSGGNSLELAAGASAGSIGGLGTNFVHFDTVSLDPGATWTLTKNNAAATVVNAGSLTIDSGASLDISTAVDPASTGSFALAAGATLEIAANAGSGDQISFLNPADLVVDKASLFGADVGQATYTGPLLEGFGAGDQIFLDDIAPTGLSLAYTAATGLLQISSGGSAVATLLFQNSSLGSGTFQAANDGSGHTMIALG